MYVDELYSYGEGNIISYDNTIAYYYEIKPINSLYSSQTQLHVLIQNMFEKITEINMPGSIMILPKRINEQSIINHHEDLFKLHGKKELTKLRSIMMKDIKKNLTKAIKYRYRIFLVFTDGRDELKKRITIDMLKQNNNCLDKHMIDLCEIVDEQIFKKLSSNLSTTKPNVDATEELHKYLAIPVEGDIVDHYTTPSPSELQQDYRFNNQYKYEQVFTRTLIASKFERSNTELYTANTAVNDIQFYQFPVDVVIKFDLVHTAKFKKNMTSKRVELKKSARRYYNLSDRKDTDAIKAVELAKIGEQSDPSVEDSKIYWQMMFRVRANSLDMLNKRSDNIRKKFEGKKIDLTYAIGEQEKLANNLMPYKNAFRRYIELTDIMYFCQFNYLGGIYIGEEDIGVLLTNTRPADLPIRVDLEAPIKGKAKSASSTTVITGETGSGKSQLANNILLLAMVFYGHNTLIIDPKDDRNELCKFLNSYGDIASRLVIGGKDSPSGMFDPFLLHDDDLVYALSIAKNDLTQIARALNKDQKIDFGNYDKAFEAMCIAKGKGSIKRITLSRLVDYLIEFDPVLASNLNSMRKDPNARLFFADDDTDLSYVFDFKRPLNLITFNDVPVYSDDKRKISFNSNDTKHNLFALCFGKIDEITSIFLRQHTGKAKTELFDEAKIYSSIPGGHEVLVNSNLIARSHLCNLLILTQNWTDVPDSIINNTGQFFVGNMKSKTEIAEILNHFDLDNGSSIGSSLLDVTKAEGVSLNKKYNFLYCDYNNRKCMTKLDFLEHFEEALTTFKKDDTPKASTKNQNIGDKAYV